MISLNSCSNWEQAPHMALGSHTCRHILQMGLLNCGLEHTGTERNVRTPGGERWAVEAGWGVGQRTSAAVPIWPCGSIAACLMNALRRWDQTSDRTLQHNFSTGESALRPRHPIQAHRRGKPWFYKKKVYYLLKCFTLGMTMCLHNTYRRVKPLYIEK